MLKRTLLFALLILAIPNSLHAHGPATYSTSSRSSAPVTDLSAQIGPPRDLLSVQARVASRQVGPGTQSVPDQETITRLQIFLDEHSFGPGKIDGRRSSDFYTIPPGPRRSPVGIVWIGVNKKGIGIHGTDSPDTIGRSASHGCIRLANWDASRLINQVTRGMTVEIF